MYRYFALVWRAIDMPASATAERLQARLAEAHPWRCVIRRHGFALFDTGGSLSAQTLALPEEAGAILGRIFRRDGPGGFNEDMVKWAGPKALIDRYWGQYVGILRDPYNSAITVVRDPSGALPCLLVQHDNVHLIFSDLEDCQALGVIDFSVDWSYLAAALAYPIMACRDTALNQVSELQPGEAFVFDRGSTWRELWWNPLEVAQRERIEDFSAATQQLCAATHAAVHACAEGHEKIVLALSGGLDSSIVLSCLASTPAQITCVNHFGNGPAEDERRYARLMAQHAGTTLKEHPVTPADVDLRRVLELRPSARPSMYLHELTVGRVETALALETGATTIFSGAGGDGVFFQSYPHLTVMDYALERGFAGLMPVALAVAMRSGKSVWSLLGQALSARLNRRAKNPMQLEDPSIRSVVNADFLRLAGCESRFQPLWLASEWARRARPGVLWHALTVSLAPVFYSAFERTRPQYAFPLLSTLVVETALRIPTYLLMRGGVDRAVARQAFDLPPQISQRYDKGGANDAFRDILDHNLDFVREVMLDGSLATRGYLDRAKLEVYLTPGKAARDGQYTEILQNYFCMQAWLNRWEH